MLKYVIINAVSLHSQSLARRVGNWHAHKLCSLSAREEIGILPDKMCGLRLLRDFFQGVSVVCG
jgi:hypothetical protein